MGKSDSVIIIIVLVIAGYFLLKGNEIVKKQYTAVTKAVGTVQDEYLKSGGKYTTTTSTGEKLSQGRGFSTQHPTDSFERFIGEQSPIISIPVWLGTLENSLIDYATDWNPMEEAAKAGAEFRIALEKSGDVERFEDMSLYGRALPTIGETIGRTFLDWSPYEAGQDFAQWWNS